VLAVIMLAGALIRQYFVLRHSGKNPLALPGIATALLVAVAIVIAPSPRATTAPSAGAASASPQATFARVQTIIHQRCTVCHAEKPSFAGFQQPPGGLLLDTPERIKAAAPRIHQQTIATNAMPIGNLTKMTDDERRLLGAWLAAGAPLN
jgi:uncharacterized membrane protein